MGSYASGPLFAARLVVVVAAVSAIACVTAGCDSPDPTAQTLGLDFLNDTSQTVRVGVCSNDKCNSATDASTARRGEAVHDAISDRNVITRWLVTDQHGTSVGCLPLRFQGKFADIRVRISQAVRCPGNVPLNVEHGRRLSGEQ
jgi:hypothetical protein